MITFSPAIFPSHLKFWHTWGHLSLVSVKHCHQHPQQRYFSLFFPPEHSQHVFLNLPWEVCCCFLFTLLLTCQGWSCGNSYPRISLLRVFLLLGCSSSSAEFKGDTVSGSFEPWNLTNIHTDIPSNSLQPCASPCDVETVVRVQNGKCQTPFVKGSSFGFAYCKYLYTANA